MEMHTFGPHNLHIIKTNKYTDVFHSLCLCSLTIREANDHALNRRKTKKFLILMVWWK